MIKCLNMIVDSVALRISNNFNNSDHDACDEFNKILSSNAIAVFWLKSVSLVAQLLPSVERKTRGKANKIHGDTSPVRGANNCKPLIPLRAA